MKTVITGGSSGIGEACAYAFARLGHELVLGARRMDRLQAVAAECEKLGSPKAQALALDVRSLPSIEAFAAAAGAPDVLLNNAGLASGRDAVQAVKDSDLTVMVDTNVTGFVRVARAFLPGMIERKSGHLIMLGSYAAHGIYEGGSVYAATKHAVRAITQTLRLEISGSGLRVTELDPGLVETEFSIVRTGSVEKAKQVYAGFPPLTAVDIADCAVWAATRPAHVNISEIVLTPVAQSSLTKVHRG